MVLETSFTYRMPRQEKELGIESKHNILYSFYTPHLQHFLYFYLSLAIVQMWFVAYKLRNWRIGFMDNGSLKIWGK